MEASGISCFHWPQLSAIDLGLFRSPGPGLGNLMFPIARALFGQTRHGGEFVYPTMRQVKLGPFLRFERDKRTYGGVLQPRSAREWQAWFAARRRRAVDEHEFDGTQTGVTVRYAGIGRCFHDLDGPSELMRDWLVRNMRGRPSAERFDIGIHVRLGDFVHANSAGDAGTQNGDNVRLSMEWYREAFEQARRILGVETPSVVLFTDSDPERVARDLGLREVAADRSQNALAAMLRLAQARLLVTSRSTFSMWAAYLGNAPAIWDRTYDRARWIPCRSKLDYEV